MVLVVHVFPDSLIELSVSGVSPVFGVDIPDKFGYFVLVKQLFFSELLSELLVREVAVLRDVEFAVVLIELVVGNEEIIVNFLENFPEIIALCAGLSMVMLAVTLVGGSPTKIWTWVFGRRPCSVFLRLNSTFLSR